MKKPFLIALLIVAAGYLTNCRLRAMAPEIFPARRAGALAPCELLCAPFARSEWQLFRELSSKTSARGKKDLANSTGLFSTPAPTAQAGMLAKVSANLSLIIRQRGS